MAIFVIDNNKRYTAHALYLVEADPKEFTKIWSVYQKAWPKDACGKAKCRQHRSCEPCTLVAILDKIEWYEGEPASIQSWLNDIETSLDIFTADIEAAKEFIELAKTYNECFEHGPLWLYDCK